MPSMRPGARPPSGGPTPAAPGERRYTLAVAAMFILSILASLALAVVYALGGQPQVEGACLAVSLAGLGAGIILWAKDLLIPEEIAEDREPESSSPLVRAATEAALVVGERQLTRRPRPGRPLSN
jgi:ubiquinol-cytochrome c reductase iron-sulfur subunit